MRVFDAAALLDGNEAALADAIDELSPELYRYAASILLSTVDAPDAVQTAFVKLWLNRKNIRDPDSVRSYLYRCTLRACVDIMRQQKYYIVPPVKPEERPMREDLARAMEKLSAEDRAIFYERAVEDTPYADLAKRLGMHEATVRKKYERTKKKLAVMLSPHEKRREDHETVIQ